MADEIPQPTQVQLPTDAEGNVYGSSVTANNAPVNAQLPTLQAPNFADEYNSIVNMLHTLSPRNNINQATPEEKANAQPKPADKPAVAATPETGMIQQILQNLMANAGGTSTGGAASAANTAGANVTSSMNTALQTAAQTQQASQQSKSGGGGGGGLLGDIGKAAVAILAWVICTELMRQGRMPKKYWITGSKVFSAYPEPVKQGYYLWAIPSVYHIRRHPGSLYSNFLCMIFNWRAENIAHYAGVSGARKLLRGMMVTVLLWPICYFLGLLVAVTKIELNWRKLYDPSTSR